MTRGRHPAMTTPDPVDVYVGNAIRARRKVRGVSQERLGEAAGVSFQQIQKYERGSNRVSASMLARIAQALGCRSADLMPPEEGEENAEVRGAMELLAADGGMELVRAYLSLSPARRRSVVAIALALAQEGE